MRPGTHPVMSCVRRFGVTKQEGMGLKMRTKQIPTSTLRRFRTALDAQTRSFRRESDDAELGAFLNKKRAKVESGERAQSKRMRKCFSPRARVLKQGQNASAFDKNC